MGASNPPASEAIRFSDMFWSVQHSMGGRYCITHGLVYIPTQFSVHPPDRPGDRDVYGYSLPTFCEALLGTDWQSPDALLAYHNTYGLYWKFDYEARFPNGSCALAYALARFQTEILSLRTAVDLAAALRAKDRSAVRRLVSRAERAKSVLFEMCKRRGQWDSYTSEVATWHELGDSGSAVRFLGNQQTLETDVDFTLVLEPVPFLPSEWEAMRDAWAADEPSSPPAHDSAAAWHDPPIYDVVGEISDLLRVPCIRPYFESRGGPSDLRFFLSWELHDLADFVRLGIAMYLARGLLPVHCASESCQRYFIPTRPRQVYCSKECQRAQAVRRHRQRKKEPPRQAKGRTRSQSGRPSRRSP